jgi:hypothetical protein
MNGRGTLYFENGDMYNGEFIDGIKGNNGAYQYHNNDIYEG